MIHVRKGTSNPASAAFNLVRSVLRPNTASCHVQLLANSPKSFSILR